MSKDTIYRQQAIDAYDKVRAVFRDLGLSNAYDMPGFWYNGKKDYKVIQTKYHQGYSQALVDAETRIKKILEELCYE